MSTSHILKAFDAIEKVIHFINESGLKPMECNGLSILNTNLIITFYGEVVIKEKIENEENIIAYISWTDPYEYDFIMNIGLNNNDLFEWSCGGDHHSIPNDETELFNLRMLMNVPDLVIFDKYKQFKNTYPHIYIDIL